ncbi:MAG TPA: SCP2 sterol-binding domain-containing protein, partial [Candidatus Lokiarchaeia archaeon]
GIEVTDKDQSFWLKANGTNIEYGDGTAKNPTFIFKTTMLQAAGIIFGDIDPTTAYMAGDITIQGNLQDALAFNDLIIVAIDAFEEIIKDL